jgi:hypothetical protein
MALALLRREEAFDHLLALLEEARGGAAVDALQALASARGHDGLRERARAIVEARDEPRLHSEFRRLFAERT